VVGQDAGLHITLLLPDHLDDRQVAARARAAGVIVAPLSEYRRSLAGPPGLVIGYARPSDGDLHTALELLARTLD
jgi:GntR family transcriptional regulator/MocR family aminotransferase